MKKLSQADELISLLSKALSDEWKAMLQYKIHASRMRGLYRDSIAEHLEEHANDEQSHADRLTIHFYSQGIPIDVNIPEFNPGNETIEMINMDLEDEIGAINLYTQIISLCEGVEELTDTRMLIEDILVDEVEHQDDNAAFIRAKVSEREAQLNINQRIVVASNLIKAADNADALGLEEIANKYTKFASEI